MADEITLSEEELKAVAEAIKTCDVSLAGDSYGNRILRSALGYIGERVAGMDTEVLGSVTPGTAHGLRAFQPPRH